MLARSRTTSDPDQTPTTDDLGNFEELVRIGEQAQRAANSCAQTSPGLKSPCETVTDFLGENGEPARVRTVDLLIKSQLLYQLSYGLTILRDAWWVHTGSNRGPSD